MTISPSELIKPEQDRSKETINYKKFKTTSSEATELLKREGL